MNKKGFTYLMLTGIIMTLLVGVFIVSNHYSRQDLQASDENRIRTGNDFVKNLNSDIHRASYIAGFRTLIALEDKISSSGSFVSDIDESFKETFFYGTIEGENASLLTNSSFQNYLERAQIIAESTGLQLDMNVTNISLNHSSPWIVDVYVTIDVNLSDRTKKAFWSYETNFITQVPIDDLRDPLYGVFTTNRVPNTIRKFNESVLVTEDNDTSHLERLVNKSYYIHSELAPSFLSRFENNSSPNPYGIESIVFIPDLSDQDIEVYQDRVKVDYIYFNDLSTTTICDVQDVPSNLYFVVTESRDLLYQIENLSYSTSCP